MEDERSLIIVEEDGLRHGFTMIPNVILRTDQLTHGAKVAYGILLSYAWGDTKTFPGQERMAVDMGVERKAVIRYLKELKDKRLVDVTRRGMGKTNVYIIRRLAEVPFLGLLDVPKTGQPDVPVNGHPDVPPMGLNEYPVNKTQLTNGNSNDIRSGKLVDRLGTTGYLDNLIVDLSREFGDTGHLASNCKQARNILAELAITEEFFVEQYVYAARQKTKHQTKVRNKMAYFFATLREMCGLEDAQEA